MWRVVRLDPAKGETRSNEHLARHPLGHVPVLEDGELTIFESVAICLYLADRFPDGKLLPPLASARALAYQWLFFAVTELEPPLSVLSAQNRKSAAPPGPAAVADARERQRETGGGAGGGEDEGHPRTPPDQRSECQRPDDRPRAERGHEETKAVRILMEHVPRQEGHQDVVVHAEEVDGQEKAQDQGDEWGVEGVAKAGRDLRPDGGALRRAGQALP